MAINKKLIHFKTKAAFEAQLAGSNILGTSIVFIQDANLIWTHGTYYGKSEIHIGTNEPTNGEIIWINSDNDEMKYFDGSQWVIVVGKAIPEETLVINLASNQTNPDSYLNGVIVNVRYLDTDHKQTWAGEALSFKIPDGVEYTIEYSDIISGGNKIYTTPNTETHTAVADKFRTLSRYYTCCKLTVVRENNQNATMGIASATITYSNYSQTASFNRVKNSDTKTIPYNVSYTITFNETMPDYRTPANITGTSNSAAITKTGSYDSEKLTVKVKGVSSGFTITVNGKKQTYTSKTYYIPYGTAYTISASNVKGYTVTVSESSITASKQTRTVTVTYAAIITNGVYICDNTGNLTTVESWNTANNSSAIGVAVVSDNCSFVIDKTVSYSYWERSGTEISGIATTSNSDTAKTDYLGESNTTKIINQLGSGNAPAAEYCRGRSCTVNGTTLYGYLGALGEWQTAYNNKSSIDSALSKIGGTAMKTGNYHLTSTQYSSSDAWTLSWKDGSVYNNYKNTSYNVRAFYPLP